MCLVPSAFPFDKLCNEVMSTSSCVRFLLCMIGGAEIQRIYRGFKGRMRAKARRSVFESDRGREAAAMAIERVFRGHKASRI